MNAFVTYSYYYHQYQESLSKAFRVNDAAALPVILGPFFQCYFKLEMQAPLMSWVEGYAPISEYNEYSALVEKLDKAWGLLDLGGFQFAPFQKLIQLIIQIIQNQPDEQDKYIKAYQGSFLRSLKALQKVNPAPLTIERFVNKLRTFLLQRDNQFEKEKKKIWQASREILKKQRFAGTPEKLLDADAKEDSDENNSQTRQETVVDRDIERWVERLDEIKPEILKSALDSLEPIQASSSPEKRLLEDILESLKIFFQLTFEFRPSSFPAYLERFMPLFKQIKTYPGLLDCILRSLSAKNLRTKSYILALQSFCPLSEIVSRYEHVAPVHSDASKVVLGICTGQLELDSDKMLKLFEEALGKDVTPHSENPLYAHGLLNLLFEMSRAFKPADPHFTEGLPLALNLYLTQLSPALRHAFLAFVEKWKKVNARPKDPQHQRKFQHFFDLNQAIIIQQIAFFGEEGVKRLSGQLGESVVKLERFLEERGVLDPRLYEEVALLREQKPEIFKNLNQLTIFEKALRVMTLLLKRLDKSDRCSPEERGELVAEQLGKIGQVSPDILLQETTVFLFQHSLDGGVDVLGKDLDVNNLFSHVDVAYLSSLMGMYCKMSKSEYRKVFLEMITLDVLGGDFNKLLHGDENEAPAPGSLAEHNQAIQKQLVVKGIHPKAALFYDKKDKVVIFPDESRMQNVSTAKALVLDDLEQLLSQVKLQSAQLKKEKSGENQEKKEVIQQQIKCLGRLKTEMGSLLKGKSEELSAGLFFQRLDRMYKFLRDQSSRQGFSSRCHEFSDRFIAHYKEEKDVLQACKKKKRSREVYRFRIEQWSKSNPDTFFLGDFVGCCIATTRAQFPAIIQRRMDDAMLFHVAIDLKTGKPAALVWLYLAEKQDEDVCLVANFFEVSAVYGNDPGTCEAILNALLSFTHDYCQANPGLKGFYMNPLPYGWNLRGLDGYPKSPLMLKDKLGGPFLPNECRSSSVKTKTKTVEKYDLSSLWKPGSEFHTFSEKVLAADDVRGSYKLEAFISKVIADFQQKNEGSTDVSAAKAYITEQYGWLVKPFFDEQTIDVELTSLIKSSLQAGHTGFHQAGLFSAKISEEGAKASSFTAQLSN